MLAGIAIGVYAPLMASMIASMVLATWLGRKVLDRVPEKQFRVVLKIILTLLALRLLWVAAGVSDWF